MNKYTFLLTIFLLFIFSACGKSIAKIAFKKNNYEVLYYYGNATSSDYLKVKHNGETKYFERVSTDSIESIIINENSISIILNYTDFTTNETIKRDTLIIK